MFSFYRDTVQILMSGYSVYNYQNSEITQIVWKSFLQIFLGDGNTQGAKGVPQFYCGQWSEKGTEKTPNQPEKLEELKTRTPRKAGESSGGLTKKGRLVSVKVPSTTFSVSF